MWYYFLPNYLHCFLIPWMENALMEGQWLGHAEGLPHGCWVGVQPILSNFSQTTAKKSTP
jgi:hypothetical protein